MARYVLATNVEGNQLFLKLKTGERGKKVAIYENVFDIIHQGQIHLSKARDVRSHKTLVNDLCIEYLKMQF
jgi:hypothetical protein